ncbi:MAG: formimidoylglutamase [Bacteroidales bacterium]|nr:formimidoylglutamase [Bacteroidales bacterium]MCF8397460.1 formimidoylglutamase [Bacteroidales bacterium]
MEIDLYFDPIDLSGYEFADKAHRKRLGDIVRSYHTKENFPSLENIDIAIIGVKEERAAIDNAGCKLAPDVIRDYFYRLFRGPHDLRIADLGNIIQGNSIEDTYFAVTTVVKQLLEHSIFPIIIGGSQDLTHANYKSYEELKRIINIVSIDPLFDLGEKEDKLSSRSYLSKIILNQPNYLFNFTNMGYQTYFIDDQAIELMENLFFDCIRLGEIRSDLEESEPLLRNADMISFDISAIRQSDAPGNGNASPNGFYGEEACQIMRYAGMSDKLNSLGIYEVNPAKDVNGQTSHLAAQMIWYFIDGYYNRKKEFLHKNKKHFLKYMISIKDHKEELVFYKSKKSDRWWMEVPVKSSLRIKFTRHHFVPCSYHDYQTALNNDIPDKWWRTYQKLM